MDSKLAYLRLLAALRQELEEDGEDHRSLVRVMNLEVAVEMGDVETARVYWAKLPDRMRARLGGVPAP